MKKIKLAAAIAALSVLGAPVSVAWANPVSSEVGPDLVTNGGFETGNFSGWTVSGNLANTSVSTTPVQVAHSPTHGVLAGAVTTLNFIEQTIVTTPGAIYNIHIWVANVSDDSATELRVDWGGATVLDIVNLVGEGIHDYTEFVIDPMATGATMNLKIGSRDDTHFLYYDDISVRLTQVPEPASVALLALGITGLGFARRRKNNA